MPPDQDPAQEPAQATGLDRTDTAAVPGAAAAAEIALVTQAQQELPYGTRAFETLAQQHYDRVRQIALGILGDADAADSVTQEVMLRVYHHLPSLQSPAHFRGWLRQIIMNCCNTWFSREQRERDKALRLARQQLDSMPAGTSSTGKAGDEGFAALVADLAPEERTILAFKFIEDLDFNEIASIVGMGLSATKMRYYRALEKIRAQANEE